MRARGGAARQRRLCGGGDTNAEAEACEAEACEAEAVRRRRLAPRRRRRGEGEAEAARSRPPCRNRGGWARIKRGTYKRDHTDQDAHEDATNKYNTELPRFTEVPDKP